MNISLTPEQTQLIQTELDTGHYSTVSDLLNEALQLLIIRRATQYPNPHTAFDILQQNGFIGSLEDEPDLSSNYKSIAQNQAVSQNVDC